MLISPTVLQKKKLREMILKLYPQYSYIKYRANGLITLSNSFWSYIFGKKWTIHITELCTVYIPERLENIDSRNNGDIIGYERVYNEYSHIVLDLLHHRANGIIDYLYDEYTYIKYGIHKRYLTLNDLVPQPTYTLPTLLATPVKEGSVVLSPLSNTYIKQALKRWSEVSTVLNHPAILSKYLDTWFRIEVKKQLNKLYNVQISIAYG